MEGAGHSTKQQPRHAISFLEAEGMLPTPNDSGEEGMATRWKERTWLMVEFWKPGKMGRRCSRSCVESLCCGPETQVRSDSKDVLLGHIISIKRFSAKAYSANIMSNWATISNKHAQEPGDVVGDVHCVPAMLICGRSEVRYWYSTWAR